MNIDFLRKFFSIGYKPWGSSMGEYEDVNNATDRNLACLSDEDLKRMRNQLYVVISKIDMELASREDSF